MNIKNIKAIPAVIGALGSTSRKLKDFIEELEENSNTTVSFYIKEGFRLWMFVETGLREEKKVAKWKGEWFQKLNRCER